MTKDLSAVAGASPGALELVESWAKSPSDPPLSEHTLFAISDGSAFVAIDGDKTALVTLSPTSLKEVGLVELAALSSERLVAHWHSMSEAVTAEARRRGYRAIEVIDRGSLLGPNVGTPGRSIVRMTLSSADDSADGEVSGDPMPTFGELAALIRKSFAGHPENGGWTVSDVETRVAQTWFDPNGFFTEMDAGRLVGFCWTKVHPDGVGEIYLIAVDPEFGGRGVGRRLVARALRYLDKARDCEEVIVYLEVSNLTARRLYERSGFSEDRTDRRLGIEL